MITEDYLLNNGWVKYNETPTLMYFSKQIGSCEYCISMIDSQGGPFAALVEGCDWDLTVYNGWNIEIASLAINKIKQLELLEQVYNN